MKQFKEIFLQKSVIWLILELILVSVACWWAFNPVIRYTYINMLPYGYDTRRIVKMEWTTTMNQKERFNISGDDYISLNSEQQQLLNKIQELDDVEIAYQESGINDFGFDGDDFNTYWFEGDSVFSTKYEFERNSKIFQAYGIESLTPGIPTSELTNDCEEGYSVIISRSMAMCLFGSIDVAGKTIQGQEWQWNEEKRESEYVKKPLRIRAVVEDVRSNYSDYDYCSAYKCDWGSSERPFIVRLRDGVNANRFIEECKKDMQHSLVTEHCYIRNMQSLQDYLEESFKNSWWGRETRRNLLVSAFFACNLTFGVIGTLLMYTRQRKEEAGIKMAFGATRLSVFLGFLREAWVITTFSFLIACLIILQLGFTNKIEIETYCFNPAIPHWFNNFWSHFFVVSGIVYLIILSFVLIGTTIPAWRISRTKITEALRD